MYADYDVFKTLRVIFKAVDPIFMLFEHFCFLFFICAIACVRPFYLVNTRSAIDEILLS